MPQDDCAAQDADYGKSEWCCPATGAACRAPEAAETFVPHTAWDADRKVRFLDHLALKCDVRAACAGVGMSRTSAYLLRRRDAVFARGWQAALVLARAHVKEVLATRALDGVEEAVWFRGERVGVKRRFDTRLLLAHLARLDRATAGDEAAAARFDETLALVADEAPDYDLVAEQEGPLPPPREVYVEAAAERDFSVANDAWLDETEAIDRALEVEYGEAEAAGGVYPPAPDYGTIHDRHAAQWDGWQRLAFARVGAALAARAPQLGPDTGGWDPRAWDAAEWEASARDVAAPDEGIEYKALGGLGGAALASDLAERGGAVSLQDRVNRVNLGQVAGAAMIWPPIGSPLSGSPPVCSPQVVRQGARPGAGCAGMGTRGRFRGYGV